MRERHHKWINSKPTDLLGAHAEEQTLTTTETGLDEASRLTVRAVRDLNRDMPPSYDVRIGILRYLMDVSRTEKAGDISTKEVARLADSTPQEVHICTGALLKNGTLTSDGRGRLLINPAYESSVSERLRRRWA